MRDKIIGYGLLALSILLFALCGAAFFAMLQALTVSSTISAIESAFGTLVAGLLLLAMARKAYRVGKTRIKSDA